MSKDVVSFRNSLLLRSFKKEYDLNFSHIAVLNYIVYKVGKRSERFVCYEEISKSLGLAKINVSGCVERLVEIGLINFRYVRHKRKVYSLNEEMLFSDGYVMVNREVFSCGKYKGMGAYCCLVDLLKNVDELKDLDYEFLDDYIFDEVLCYCKTELSVLLNVSRITVNVLLEELKWFGIDGLVFVNEFGVKVNGFRFGKSFVNKN